MQDAATPFPVTPPPVRAGRHEALLQPKVIGRAERLSGPAWFTLLVLDGTVELRAGEARETVAAPALIWRAWGREDSARLSAGTVAAHILVGANALSNAFGNKPESQDLRALAARPIIAPIDVSNAALQTLQTCFSAVQRETIDTRPASATLVEAYLQILLIEMWRLSQAKNLPARRMTPSQRVFDHFIVLVERHFRDRWQVARYAQALGLSRDRLGDICHRVHRRRPKDIVDGRTEREALLLLQNSTNSVEEIAGLLGFHSGSQFSSFLRRRTGASPGRLRRALEAPRDAATALDLPASLHDWP